MSTGHTTHIPYAHRTRAWARQRSSQRSSVAGASEPCRNTTPETGAVWPTPDRYGHEPWGTKMLLPPAPPQKMRPPTAVVRAGPAARGHDAAEILTRGTADPRDPKARQSPCALHTNPPNPSTSNRPCGRETLSWANCRLNTPATHTGDPCDPCGTRLVSIQDGS